MWLHESESNSIITEAYENKIFLTIIYISYNSLNFTATFFQSCFISRIMFGFEKITEFGLDRARLVLEHVPSLLHTFGIWQLCTESCLGHKNNYCAFQKLKSIPNYQL